MNKTKAAKYRQAKKELTAKQKAAKTKYREVRLRRDKLKAINCTPPKDKPIELKVQPPISVSVILPELEDKIEQSLVSEEDKEAVVIMPPHVPDTQPMSAARRAFLGSILLH